MEDPTPTEEEVHARLVFNALRSSLRHVEQTLEPGHDAITTGCGLFLASTLARLSRLRGDNADALEEALQAFTQGFAMAVRSYFQRGQAIRDEAPPETDD